MKGIVAITVGLVRVLERASTKKWSFLGIFAVLFLGSIVVLSQFNLLPDTQTTEAAAAPAQGATSSATSTPAVVAGPEAPVKISIPSIQLTVTVANPTSLDDDVLDQALLHGAVRYPTSAELNEDGNVVIFGHSSYLPIVGNQAYKTFDGIQKLTAGSIITVYSSDMAYTYSVQSVTKESANSAGIPLSVTGRVLTLSTCDSFGEKTDRFVVVANFVDSYSISS